MTLPLLILLTAQILIGGLDNLLHHEITEKLPARVSARTELALHAARELSYGVLLVTLAWLAPQGFWAWALLAVVALEIAITLADFVEEDRTRTLPPFERVLHTILALNFGAILALGAPVWAAWAAAPTGLAFEAHGMFSWFFTLTAVGVLIWSARNFIAALSLARKARAASRDAAPLPSGRTILVTGATGFLGEALTRRLLAAGDAVIVTSRDVKRATALFDGRVLAVSDLAQLPGALRLDAVVNLAGAGVANAPWSHKRRRELLASRVDAAAAIGALAARLEHKSRVLINASAVGYYGDRGDHALTENAKPGAGFTSDLCAAWEAAAVNAGAGFARVVRLRFGLVFGRDGGAWPRLAAPLAFGVATMFGDGRQWMAWIHKEDALGLIEAALVDDSISGPVNAVAPQESRHGDVIAAMAEARGALLTISAPAWALRLALGDMAHLFLDSQRVLPRAAGVAGFVFKHPDIESACADLLGRSSREMTHRIA